MHRFDEDIQPAGVRDLPAVLRRHLGPHQNTIVATGTVAGPVLGAIVAWARARRLDLSALEVRPPTLEDAYLTLTRDDQTPSHRTEPSHA